MSTDPAIFKTRGPLDPDEDGAILVARPELTQVLRFARASQVDAYVALLSSRQTGKTTLLYQVSACLRSPGFAVVLIDLGSVQDQPEAQLYNFVARAMRQELLPKADPKATLPTTAVEFQNFMLETARRVTAMRILLLLDEVEAVPAKLSDGFFGTFRSVFSTRHKEPAFEKYLVVLSGAKELSRLTSGSNSPLNIAERVYLQDFTRAGVEKLTENFQRLGLVIPPETATWIHARTGGHPYLTQKLCAMIAERQPKTLSQEMVERCAQDLLRGDDHLEKMIVDIESEPNSKNMLGRIVAGDAVPFSRLNPQLARLELTGAIRDAGQCVVRNQIYDEAFKRLYQIGGGARTARTLFMRAKPVVLVLMALIIAINVPLMFFYLRDVMLGAHPVNQVFAPEGWNIYTLIRYDDVLRPNAPVTITVDLEHTRALTPVVVVLRENAPDMVVLGEHQKRFATERRTETFSFFLNQRELPYNPFAPATETRRVDLIFQSESPGRPPQTQSAEFKVDYYSAFIKSVYVSLIGLIGLVTTWVGNLQKVKGALGGIQKIFKMIPQ
ncbi:MAG: AAA-like domain-containing protein [Chloroflexi bacterium]|nr:AAA-like domain-containing protein [Chloroflexota bacterium]